MLPGFRFLFTAIVLSMSILIFGLGAAALLRAAHEEFASMPSRRAPPEPVFAQQSEPPAPTLALLRVDPPVAEKAPDNVAAAAAPAEQAQDVAPSAEPEKLAALKVEDAPSPEATKPETSKPETSKPEGETPAVETMSTMPATQPETPASTDEPRLAAIAETPPPVTETAPIAAEPTAEVPAPEVSIASTKIATLGGPAVTIEQTAAGKADATPDRSAAGKRAQRARERRHSARRGRVARPAVAAQSPADPFAQPAVARASR
jgi:hypothetical protein